MHARRIRLIIVEDHRLCRECLQQVFAEKRSIEIVAQAASGPQTIDVISELKPDIVLVGITVPASTGIQLISDIKASSPATKAILLTGAEDEQVIMKAIQAGAEGYIPNGTSISGLFNAIEAVAKGELWIERKIVAKYVHGDITADERLAASQEKIAKTLTPREQDVLRILIQGATNKEIGEQLFICEKTVKSHLNSIYKKLNVRRRLEAILWAVKHGFS